MPEVGAVLQFQDKPVRLGDRPMDGKQCIGRPLAERLQTGPHVRQEDRYVLGYDLAGRMLVRRLVEQHLGGQTGHDDVVGNDVALQRGHWLDGCRADTPVYEQFHRVRCHLAHANGQGIRP